MAKKSNPESNPDIQDGFPKIGTPLDPVEGREASRRMEFTASDLERVCREIRKLAGDLEEKAARMDRNKIQTIVSDGAQRWRRGCVMISNFIRTCQSGLHDAEHGISRQPSNTAKK